MPNEKSPKKASWERPGSFVTSLRVGRFWSEEPEILISGLVYFHRTLPKVLWTKVDAISLTSTTECLKDEYIVVAGSWPGVSCEPGQKTARTSK